MHLKRKLNIATNHAVLAAERLKVMDEWGTPVDMFPSVTAAIDMFPM